MFEFFSNNLATMVVGAVVFAGVAAAIYKIIRDKKQGKGSCSCGCSCSGCPSAGLCHKKP